MRARDLTERDLARVSRHVFRLAEAPTLDALGEVMLAAAVDLVPCEHAGYCELDPLLGRTVDKMSDATITAAVCAYLPVWQELMPTHPLLRHFRLRPLDTPKQTSDVTEIAAYRRSAIFNELMVNVDTDQQAVLFLGEDTDSDSPLRSEPLSIGVVVNRQSRDFSARDLQCLELLGRVCRPVFRARRATLLVQQMVSGRYTPEAERCLLALGLSPRRAEVAFWMMQGKTNSEIGDILRISTQTVRHHTLGIFQRLGVSNRIEAQAAIIRELASAV